MPHLFPQRLEGIMDHENKATYEVWSAEKRIQCYTPLLNHTYIIWGPKQRHNLPK